MCAKYFHSVALNAEKCIGCTSCLKNCPTEAIRLKDRKAHIIEERCIDCGECIRVCPAHAKIAVTNSLDIINKFKYIIALTLPILYGQFMKDNDPVNILSSLKSLGFDEVADTTIGSEIVDSLSKDIIENYSSKPVINSSCPAILRLIQVRFPELLKNVIDIQSPVEITAALLKDRASKQTGIPHGDIGVILITPCTARMTSIKNPLGKVSSSVDGVIAIKDIYKSLLKSINSTNEENHVSYPKPTRNGIFWYHTGGQISKYFDKAIAIDGINNAISILEEIELGKLDDLSFVEITACPGSCLGGPLVVENRYIALKRMHSLAKNLDDMIPTNDDIKKYTELYATGAIRMTEELKPQSILSLDSDIAKSIDKLEKIRIITKSLPGINCGLCGSPTCQAFAEDFITEYRKNAKCPIAGLICNSSDTYYIK